MPIFSPYNYFSNLYILKYLSTMLWYRLWIKSLILSNWIPEFICRKQRAKNWPASLRVSSPYGNGGSLWEEKWNLVLWNHHSRCGWPVYSWIGKKAYETGTRQDMDETISVQIELLLARRSSYLEKESGEVLLKLRLPIISFDSSVESSLSFELRDVLNQARHRHYLNAVILQQRQ